MLRSDIYAIRNRQVTFLSIGHSPFEQCYLHCENTVHVIKKVKVVVLESRLHDNTYSVNFTFPLARWVPMQPAPIDPTSDLCTRYLLWLVEPRQCGIHVCRQLESQFASTRHPSLLLVHNSRSIQLVKFRWILKNMYRSHSTFSQPVKFNPTFSQILKSYLLKLNQPKMKHIKSAQDEAQ